MRSAEEDGTLGTVSRGESCYLPNSLQKAVFVGKVGGKHGDGA
jgi:hypothetical protein